MAQRKPKRKKIISRPKPEKFTPQNRAERRRIERQKTKKGEKEWKDMLILIIGLLIMVAIAVILNHIERILEQPYEKE